MIIQVKGYEETLELRRTSVHQQAYIELAQKGMVRRHFKNEYDARSFRHSAMRKFKNFGTKTGITTDSNGFLIVTVKLIGAKK